MKHSLNGKLSRIANELVGKGLTLSQGVGEFERQLILATLRQNDGNLTRSAKSLGIHRNTLRNKVSNLGIRPRDLLAGSSQGRAHSARKAG